jgi:hypothetical protein
MLVSLQRVFLSCKAKPGYWKMVLSTRQFWCSQNGKSERHSLLHVASTRRKRSQRALFVCMSPRTHVIGIEAHPRAVSTDVHASVQTLEQLAMHQQALRRASNLLPFSQNTHRSPKQKAQRHRSDIIPRS